MGQHHSSTLQKRNWPGRTGKGLLPGQSCGCGCRNRTGSLVVPGLCRDAAAILWVELESGSPSPAVELLTNSPHSPPPSFSSPWRPLHYSLPLDMWFGSSWWAWPAVLWAVPLFHWAAAEYIWYKPYGVFRNHATPTSMGTLWKCKSSMFAEVKYLILIIHSVSMKYLI